MVSFLNRFNFLFLFTFSLYVFSIASILLKEKAPEYFFPVINFISEPYVLYLSIGSTIVISFIQNYNLSKSTSTRRILDRTIVLTCFELSIMLLGTFAALMFFLVVLFSQDTDLQIKVILFAVGLVIANYYRQKIVRRLNRNLRLN